MGRNSCRRYVQTSTLRTFLLFCLPQRTMQEVAWKVFAREQMITLPNLLVPPFFCSALPRCWNNVGVCKCATVKVKRETRLIRCCQMSLKLHLRTKLF